jgi:hypothetical protein
MSNEPKNDFAALYIGTAIEEFPGGQSHGQWLFLLV